MFSNFTNNRSLFFICFALVLAPSVGAARSVKAIFLGASSHSPVKAHLVMGEKSVEIELPRSYLSGKVEIPDGDLIVAVSPRAPLANTPLDPALPSVQIPESSKSGLLLFLPDPKNKAFPVRVMFIDKSSASFPRGHSLLFNLSGGTIAAKFGDQDVLIQPNKSQLISPPDSDTVDYKTAVAVRYQENERWTVFYRSIWRLNPNAHKLVFVTATPGRKYPRIWSVLDTSKD